jgi:haloalkane dehalogenase
MVILERPAVKEQYPFASKYFDQNGFRQHYLDEGSGDPVVMVHGNPTWSFYYRRLAADLRRDHRVIVPDHVGCGLSDKPQTQEYPYTLERRVDDLDRLLAHCGLERNVTLVVHDWGGMIAMAWAERHPEKIARLVILNTAAFHLPEGKAVPWQLKLARTPLGTVLVRGLNAFCRGAASDCVTRRPLSRDVRDAYLAPYDSWGNRAAVLRFVQDIPLAPEDPGYDLITKTAEGLARFRDTPALVCWGMRDFVFDGDYLAEWERRLPNAAVHRFPDCGHYVLEDASEEILALVREFLKQNPLR